LIAKIHTVEWTPAVIAHPTTRYAMHANWWGLAGERLGKRFGRVGKSEVLSGIPGSPTDHHGVPYSLTEEFVAVYRMHPLLPDDFVFRSISNDEVLQERTFRELGALQTRTRLEELGVANTLYSLGVAHPGAITLHNYPRFLQHFERPDGTVIDLAATDVLRVRERGVPRYNQFRRLFRLRVPDSFEELTDNATWADEIRRVYDGDLDRVDLMIGLYAEPKPKGFGFSDTAFRVFILMASRRLKSDRFLTRDYTPKLYTRAGLDWINHTSMVSVLLRHYPQLAPSLRGVENAFAPWPRVQASR
jgi:heme peroxidase